MLPKVYDDLGNKYNSELPPYLVDFPAWLFQECHELLGGGSK